MNVSIDHNIYYEKLNEKATVFLIASGRVLK